MDPGSGEIERLFTPHFARGRGGERPRAIVVHTTAGSFAGTADWFADPESGVSAHYLVGLDGRIAQFVDETDAARHAGRVLRPTASIAQGRDDLNPVTIGIELEDGGDAEHVERPDAQYAAAATLIAAAGERWEIPIDREHVIGHREAFAAKACPGNVDLERLVALAGSSPRGAAKHAREQALLCLLPIRDGAEDLPGYLSSTEALSADVLALDDGSADGSAEVLRAHPRVIEVLRPEAEDPDAGTTRPTARRCSTARPRPTTTGCSSWTQTSGSIPMTRRRCASSSPPTRSRAWPTGCSCTGPGANGSTQTRATSIACSRAPPR